MLNKVAVVSGEDFVKWYEGKRAELAAKVVPPGPRLFQEKGCNACHTVDGSPLVGPTLKGLFGKTVIVLAQGKERQLVADETYLKRSLIEPGADVVKGFPPIMPSQKGVSTEAEIEEMIKYIKELK
jgi:cytochrome c oxidase subunit 2